VALEKFFVFVVIGGAALRERLDEAARSSRGIEKQDAASFAASVLPDMRHVARHECAGARPANSYFAADFEGELPGWPLTHPAFLPGQSIGHCHAARRAGLVLGWWWVVAVEASSGEHKLRWRLLTNDGNVEITGRDLRGLQCDAPKHSDVGMHP
jgi:hypothetical protein